MVFTTFPARERNVYTSMRKWEAERERERERKREKVLGGCVMIDQIRAPCLRVS